jgi:hypothetical protein
MDLQEGSCDKTQQAPTYRTGNVRIAASYSPATSDKAILSTGIALQSLVARCVGRVTPTDKHGISDEERKQILKQQADAVGLTSEEVGQAIRE